MTNASIAANVTIPSTTIPNASNIVRPFLGRRPGSGIQ